MITIDDYWLTFLISTGLPILVALVTRQFAQKWFKGILLAILSAATGVGMSVQQAGGSLEWKAAITGFFISFVTAVGVHYGLLKPATVTGSEGKLAKWLPQGLGPERTMSAVPEATPAAAEDPGMPKDRAGLKAWHEELHSQHHIYA